MNPYLWLFCCHNWLDLWLMWSPFCCKMIFLFFLMYLFGLCFISNKLWFWCLLAFYMCFIFRWNMVCSFHNVLWFLFPFFYSFWVEITLGATLVTTLHRFWWGIAWFTFSCRLSWFRGLCSCHCLRDPFLEFWEA